MTQFRRCLSRVRAFVVTSESTAVVIVSADLEAPGTRLFAAKFNFVYPLGGRGVTQVFFFLAFGICFLRKRGSRVFAPSNFYELCTLLAIFLERLV